MPMWLPRKEIKTPRSTTEHTTNTRKDWAFSQVQTQPLHYPATPDLLSLPLSTSPSTIGQLFPRCGSPRVHPTRGCLFLFSIAPLSHSPKKKNYTSTCSCSCYLLLWVIRTYFSACQWRLRKLPLFSFSFLFFFFLRSTPCHAHFMCFFICLPFPLGLIPTYIARGTLPCPMVQRHACKVLPNQACLSLGFLHLKVDSNFASSMCFL